ncbi:WD repeats region domain-containing protein [Linnemannia hyalina]|uniref:WD repeats region domain-containing protein n=1 Tax=Linnemannia hyalina TaxID=64524 RepID=A0A9P7XXC4_9FUNG|nr:WD repeats region domain-containing protein [Linnemannia hyalina]
MVEASIQDTVKDTNKITDTVALGLILQKEPYRKLLSSFITEFEESPLLNANLLQGLVQLVQSSSPSHLVFNDLVKILSILRIRLQGTHQQSIGHPYYLTLAISKVLDVMAAVVNVSASSQILKQELASENTPMVHHPYPLRSRLPTSANSPILAKVQNIRYLEYRLYKLRLQRLQEYNERAIYIYLQAKPSLLAKNDELFPLLERVLKFLASDGQVMLILGDSGSGKLTFNRHLEHLLWKDYKRGGPIPLFINLPTIDEPQHDLVNKRLQFHNFNEDQIIELKLHHQLVLICYGYDESQQLVNLHRTNSLNQTGQWDTKVIIGCRSQYLGTSYQDRFRPQSVDRYKPVPQNVFQEAITAPFSMERIHNYVEQYVPLEPRTWSTQDYMDRLTTIPNFMDLVKIPFLLSLALEALLDVTKGNQDLSAIKIVRIQLYDVFVDHWLSVNKKRLQSNSLSRQDSDMLEMLEDAVFEAMGVDSCKRLASAMFEKLNGKAVVKYLHLKDKTAWKVEYFGPDPEVRLLREASPWTRSGIFFQFLHRSMLGYFFSCTVVGSTPTCILTNAPPADGLLL